MKKLFLMVAMVLVSVVAMAQTNQLVWANGQLLYATPTERVDSLTYDASFEGDTLFFIMPHKLVQTVHDTVFVYDTVYEQEIVYVHDTIYINNGDPDAKYTKVLGTAVLGDSVEVRGYISAVSTQGPILTDDGGSVLLYKTSGVEVGDEVTVTGAISSYAKGFQIGSAVVEKTGSTTVTYPNEIMELTGAKMDELLTTRIADEYAYYAKMTGTVVFSGTYYNVSVSGAEKAKGSIYGATDEVKTALADGMECTLYGYFCSISGGKYINLIVTSIEIKTSHEYVDLGLPSGLKWATCNVGATTPEEYGDYIAWGEVEPKTTYNWSTYKYCAGSSSTMTKYCSQSSYGNNGFTDSKTVLDPEDDAAAVNWGGAWRMPTDEEWDELIDECRWTWTTENGVYGRKVTGPNGNSIFLPAAGYMREGTLSYAGSYGYYWSSSLYIDYPNCAYGVGFNSDYVDWGYYGYRYHGQSVRPVCQ